MGVLYTSTGPIYGDNFYWANNTLIGHDAKDVNDWLRKHPEFDGSIYHNLGQDDEDMDVTEVFMGEEEKE